MHIYNLSRIYKRLSLFYACLVYVSLFMQIYFVAISNEPPGGRARHTSGVPSLPLLWCGGRSPPKRGLPHQRCVGIYDLAG
jgi:hypothetical protein